MKCICCGKPFKYGWQLKNDLGICDNCRNPIEKHLRNVNLELTDLKNIESFAEIKSKVLSNLDPETDRADFQYMTAVLNKIYNIFSSNTTENQNNSIIQNPMSNSYNSSNTQNKKVPRSLKECYAPNRIAENLYEWSDRLERWGRALFAILIILGVIKSFVDGLSAADIEASIGFFTFFASLIRWSVSAFIEYLAYNAIALLISALASIVENTKISADVTLYKAAKDEEVTK